MTTMKNLLWLSACVLTSARATGDVLIDTVFDGPLHPAAPTNERVTGMLPAGWVDDSAWAPIWITYTQHEEQGLKYLRMAFTKTENGRAQLAFYPLPDANEDPTRYRLHCAMRSPTGSPVEIGLRMRGRPYEFYWKRTLAPPEEWQPLTMEFTAPRNEQVFGFWINMPEPGTLDIARFRLERLTDAERIAEIRTRFPDGGPANVLRHSRFPLGLPHGWALDRDSSDGDEATVAPHATARGPSGCPPLHLRSDTSVTVLAEPFALPCPLAEHAVTMFLRGRGDWTITVSEENRTVQTHTVTLAPEADWQRVQVPFEPDLNAVFYQLFIAGSGELVMDAVQVGPARQADTYASRDRCEIAMALPPSDAAPARIQFESDPAVVTVAVTGPRRNAVLRGHMVDVYGRTRPLPPVSVPAGNRLYRDTIALPMDAARPFGSFRVEMWIEQEGARISPFSELVLHRLRRPRYWDRDAPNSPFGVHTNSTRRHNMMAKAVGINWTRLHDAGLQYIGWWNLEPQPGEWRFFDAEIMRYRRHHIRILAELGTAPPWASYYSTSGRQGFGYFDKFFQPRDLNQYQNYVRVVCERYKDNIDAFDVWNEPWIHAWWGVDYDHSKDGRAGYVTSAEPQRDFARMMAAARTTARSIIPHATVLGFNTTTGTSNGSATRFGGDEWTAGVLDAGGLNHCDAIAYHAYTGGSVGHPGDSVEQGLAVALGPIREALGHCPKPVWMTEGSPLTHRMANGLYKHTLPFESADPMLASADRLARYLISLLANGVDRIFLYSMHAHGRYQTTPKQWNALTTDDGFLHPAGAAHSAAAWHLEDTRFVRIELLAEGVFAYLFASADRTVAAISAAPTHADWRLPPLPEAQVSDLFGNPLPTPVPFTGTVIYVHSDAPVDVLAESLKR